MQGNQNFTYLLFTDSAGLGSSLSALAESEHRAITSLTLKMLTLQYSAL